MTAVIGAIQPRSARNSLAVGQRWRRSAAVDADAVAQELPVVEEAAHCRFALAAPNEW